MLICNIPESCDNGGTRSFMLYSSFVTVGENLIYRPCRYIRFSLTANSVRCTDGCMLRKPNSAFRFSENFFLVRYFEITSYEVRYLEITTYEVRYLEIASYEVRYLEITSYEVRYLEIASYEVRYLEIAS